MRFARRPPPISARAAAVALGALPACAPPDPELARAAWMQEVLVAADRPFLGREPALVREKYAVMRAHPYDFLRGTVPWYYADLARPDPERPATRFLRHPAATAVLVFGDPHPENLSTLGVSAEADGDASFIDLDAAGFGPYLPDLRRAALGLRALASGLEGPDGAPICDEPCQDAAADALVAAWLDGVGGALAPAPGAVLGGMLEEAAEEGPGQERLRQRAPGDPPRITRDGIEHRDLRPDEALAFEAAWPALARAVPGGLRRLDAARRLGAGVSSRPAWRVAVVADRGDDGPEDDLLLELREVLDPPALPGRAVLAPAAFADNAARVVQAAGRLWPDPDGDAQLAGTCTGAQCFKMWTKDSWHQDLERDKLEEDAIERKLSADDLLTLGADLGHRLGAAHARGGTVQGGDSGAAIATDLRLGGGATALRAELGRVGPADLERLLLDHELFVDLLEREGPLLGAAALVEHRP
jgi:uncharacterized protein (DUF2252 family)